MSDLDSSAGFAHAAARGDALLLVWGRFASKRTDSGLGFPKVSPSFKDAIKGRGSAPLVPDEVFLVDAVVGSLRNDDRETFMAVYWWYVKALPLSVCAVRMRCSPRSVQRHLTKARVMVGRRVEEKKAFCGT